MKITLQDELPVINGLLAGTDEAGRGPLAGNVVAAAVILDSAETIDGLDDSKKLSEKKRQLLAALFSMISDTRQESGQARLVIRAPNSEKQENKVVDRAQEAPAVPAAVKLARAIWREETRAEKLSKEDRLARWQEVKKDRVRMAKRALKHLNDSGLSFVETGTSEA